MLDRLSRGARRAARAADRRVPWSSIHAGSRFECPCCGGRFARLRSFSGRPNARCPECGALERHRTLWLYLTQRTTLLEQSLDVLHFAAERPFESRFRRVPQWRYVSADLFPSAPHQMRVNITSMDFPDESFDVVLCNHVLVEVSDDSAAVRELFRVIRHGGLLISQEPVDHSERSPSSRGGRLGGRNLRIYGRDYIELLRSAGFDVECVPYAQQLEREVAERHAVLEAGAGATGNEIYLSRKP